MRLLEREARLQSLPPVQDMAVFRASGARACGSTVSRTMHGGACGSTMRRRGALDGGGPLREPSRSSSRVALRVASRPRLAGAQRSRVAAGKQPERRRAAQAAPPRLDSTLEAEFPRSREVIDDVDADWEKVTCADANADGARTRCRLEGRRRAWPSGASSPRACDAAAHSSDAEAAACAAARGQRAARSPTRTLSRRDPADGQRAPPAWERRRVCVARASQ